MIKAIIFDCFGVIITDGLELVVRQIEVERSEARAYISSLIHQNNRGLIDPAESTAQIADYLGLAVDTLRKMIADSETKDSTLMDWVLELRATFKTALLSNIGRGSLGVRFSDTELAEHFDEVIVSGEVGIMKPDPEIYELTAARLGLQPNECIFFDDRQSHVDGALSVHMHAFLFTTIAQAKADLEKLLRS